MTRILILTIALLCSACHVIMPESTASGFNTAKDQPAATTVKRRAWLGNVTITDPLLEQKLVSGWWPGAPTKTAVENNLRTNLAYYLHDRQFFSSVAPLPGIPTGDDLILDLEFNHYLHEQTPSGLGMFLGCFTVGIYWIIFDGRWQIDDFTYSATLTVKDSQSRVLATAQHDITESRITSFYDVGFRPASTSSAGIRSTLVDTVVSKALQQLDTPTGKPAP